MSEMKHSKEKWERESLMVTNTLGKYIGYLEDFSDDDATRMLLCVNACEGLSNEILSDPNCSIKVELETLDQQIAKRLGAERQRDAAWQELREIREAIKADENESTADMVRFRMSELFLSRHVLEDHGPNGHNVTNQQYVELRNQQFLLLEALTQAEFQMAQMEKGLRQDKEFQSTLLDVRKALGILPEQEQTTTLGLEDEQ